MVYMDCNASARYTLSSETSLESEVISSSMTTEYPIPDFVIEALSRPTNSFMSPMNFTEVELE